MKKKRNIIKIFFLIIVFFMTSSIVIAEDAGIGFEIRPITPTNQIDNSVGYYYVKSEPGKKQELELSVINTRDTDITLETIVENAISQTVGNIGYSDNLESIHESLYHPLTEILKPKEETIVVKPGEEKIVYYTLSPPENPYDGIKMGQVVIREKMDENAPGIKQRFQYAVGVIMSESTEMFNDGNKLDLVSVNALIDNGERAVHGEIINPEPKTIEQLKVRAYITKKGDSKKIKQRNIDNFSFAPNSKVFFSIPWGLSNFETGEYTFHFTGKNEFESFELKKDFKIRGDQAKQLNNEAAFVVRTPKETKITLIVLNTLLVILCVVVTIRNKNWVKELRIKKKRKNNRKKGKRK